MNINPANTHTKVTVGICVKNSGETVEDAINSVLNQDFPSELMELAIVDGNSSDKTVQVIQNCLRNTSIRARFFSESEGLGRARQVVVDNANGKYIVWVDGDMVLSRDFLRKQVRFMEQNPDVGVAKGKYGILSGLGNDSLAAFLEDVEFMLHTSYEGDAGRKVLATSGCIYRVKAIKQVAGFDPQIKGAGEDVDAESRLRNSGWKLYIGSAIFQEKRRETWSGLWDEYFWQGQGAGHSVGKSRQAFPLLKLLPPIALVWEAFRVPAAYQLTHRITVIFLPLHYLFKRIAWFFGFRKGLLER